MPAIAELAGEYQDRMAVVAPAVDSSLEGATLVAEGLFPSGRVLWGLDQNSEISSAYGFNGVPAGVIIAAGGSIAFAWSGPPSTDEMKEVLDDLLAAAPEAAGLVTALAN
ncbi:MAG: hypothetical protein J4G00_07340 [Actinomycetia bacterium]|nr:hypothetical protein [Actinomycetes bacterium]